METVNGAIESVAAKVTLGQAVSELIRQKRQQRLQQAIEKRVSSRPKNPYLSNISECDRQIVYGMTNWQDLPAIEPELKARFEAGEEQERLIVQELMTLGFKVKLAQERIEIHGLHNGEKVLLATGKIDGVIEFEGIDIPIEIKSMNENVFKRIRDGAEGLQDFERMPHTRKYLRQLKMYLHGKGKEDGLFLLTNGLGTWKILPISWDAAECEAILQRLERVYPYWHHGIADDEGRELPARIEYAEDICGRCPFAGICLPDIIRAESEVVTDTEWIEKIRRAEELKPAVSEFDDLKDDIKGRFKGVKKALAGDFIVFGREQKRKETIIPESTFWVTSIKPAAEMGMQGPRR